MAFIIGTSRRTIAAPRPSSTFRAASSASSTGGSAMVVKALVGTPMRTPRRSPVSAAS